MSLDLCAKARAGRFHALTKLACRQLRRARIEKLRQSRRTQAEAQRQITAG